MEKRTINEWLGENNKLGIDIWEKKYRYNNETFEEWLDRISNKNEELKQIIYNKEFIFGGRILANRGLYKQGRKITYSNCYVVGTDDSIEDIYRTCSELARTYSYGGGCGLDISKLRPKGATVNNAANTTSGAVSFMSTFDNVTSTIGQCGRRGALMISIDIKHPDVLDFIDIKTDLNKVTSANISVRVNDRFMQAVENNEDYYLRWPCDVENFNKDLCKEYNTMYTDTVTGKSGKKQVVYVRKIKAKDLFDKLCVNNWNYAEPGILYWDRIENYNLMSENPNFHYAGVNPCVSGDTKVLTKNGYQRIDSLVGKKVEIWNGYQWSEVEPRITGHNQKMLLVQLSDGSEVNCTEYHKFVLKDGSRVEAKDLKTGDKLVKCEFPIIQGNTTEEVPEKLAYSLGFFAGDGYVKREDEPIIYLYDEKRNLLPYIVDGTVREDPKENRIAVTIGDPDLKRMFEGKKTFVPDVSWSIQNRLQWLAGLIDADGCQQNASGCISISSVNYEFLDNVRLMLNTLGIKSKVALMHKGSTRKLPKNDGTGEYGEYNCKTSYRILISSYFVNKLFGLGLVFHRVKVEPVSKVDKTTYIKILDIRENGICDTVYCLNEPINHTFIANGTIVGNCAEEPLPLYGSCLLGSINLAAFVNEYSYDFKRLSKVAKIAYKALNEVLLEGLPLHPLQGQRDCVGKYRQVGLGIMGLADTFIKLGIKYGSEESLELSELIGQTIANAAMCGSIEAGKAKHRVSLRKKDIEKSEYFKTVATEETKEKLSKSRGFYNTQLLTIAPTGTISTMWNISGGIEPIFALYYERVTKSLNGVDTPYKVYPDIVKDYFGDQEIDLEKLPSYYVSSADILHQERIKMQSVWQKYIDASISSTVNLPLETTVDDIKNIYMSAWKNRLKGVTIFRSGCKRTAILTDNKNKKECSCKDFLENSAPKRPKSLPCKILRFRNNKENWIAAVGLYNGHPYEIFTGVLDNINIPNYVNEGVIIRNKIEVDEYDDELGKTVKKSVSRYDLQYKDGNDTKVTEGISTCFNEEYWNYGKLVSGLLRHGMPIEYIVKVISSLNFKDNGINTWKNGVIRALKKFIPDGETDDICPECGNKLYRENGCIHCPACGWSKCS